MEVDLGIHGLATVSEGTVFENPRPERPSEKAQASSERGIQKTEGEPEPRESQTPIVPGLCPCEQCAEGCYQLSHDGPGESQTGHRS